MTGVAVLANATKRYGSLVALRDASLTLAAGEAVALVGHNGAGKTTLMKLVLGLIRPSAGSVRVLGEDPAGRKGAQIRRRLGFLPESASFHAAMTGAELLAFYARLKRAPRAVVGALLEQVGIAEAANRRVGTYSKGMRQRLALAQALIGAPQLLLLDEPTSGLDPDSRGQVYATVDRLRRSGATVLISTHALAEIERHVDRIALLDHGHLVAVGDLAALRRQAALATQVRLRVQRCTTDRVLSFLPNTATVLARSDERLELTVKQAAKLDFLEDLARVRDLVLDVEIEEPGLEALYRHLTGGRQ